VKLFLLRNPGVKRIEESNGSSPMNARVPEGFKIREIESFSLYLPFKRSHKISLRRAEGKR